MTATDCEHTRHSCNELIESKIKLSVLNLKLWIVCAVVMFLVGTGSTFVCGLRSYGRIEEKVEAISKNQEANSAQIESLRQEVWKLVPVGRYHPSAQNVQPEEGNNNNESHVNAIQEYQDQFFRYIARF